MKIEDYIRPFWKTNDGEIRDDRRDDFELEIFEIIAFIATDRTIPLVVSEKIEDWLP